MTLAGTLFTDAGLPPSGRLGLQELALLLAWSLMEIAGIQGPRSESLPPGPHIPFRGTPGSKAKM